MVTSHQFELKPYGFDYLPPALQHDNYLWRKKMKNQDGRAYLHRGEWLGELLNYLKMKTQRKKHGDVIWYTLNSNLYNFISSLFFFF